MTHTYRTGLIFAIIGTACFSVKSIFIKLAYQHGASPVMLMALRMLFALPFYLVAIAYIESKTEQRIKKADAFQILIAGFLGYYLASLLDFIGLTMIDATIERLILYTYPSFVLLFSFFLKRHSLNRYFVIGAIVTYSGMIVLLGGNGFVLSEQSLFGGGLVLMSAISYALYLVMAEGTIPRVGGSRFNAYAMTVSCILILSQHVLTADIVFPDVSLPILGYGALLAIVSTVIPSFLVIAGLSKIGASQTAVLGMLGPFITIFASMLILSESMTAQQWIGATAIMCGILIVSRQGKSR